MNKLYVNRETGELAAELKEKAFKNNTKTDAKVTVNVKPGEMVRPFKPKKFKKSFDFTMVFHADSRELIRNKKLTDDEKALLFSLLVYLDYDQYVKDEKAIFFNVSRVTDLMGWSRRRTGLVLKGLTQRRKRLLGYTQIGREKYYMLNPHFIYRGTTQGLETAVKLFNQATLDED